VQTNKKMNQLTKKSFTQEEVTEILDALRQMYPEAECELDFGSHYQLLISVVLSAQTTDKSVNKVTPALFSKYPDAATLAKAAEKDLEGTIEDVAQFIRTIGMYKTKSKNVVFLSKALYENFDGAVPEDYDKLIALPGVGRKTANVVLSVGFGHQRIAVDTHVFRVSNRIGLVSEKDVLKTELALMEILPQSRWSEAHHSLIFHGRYCCDARKPKCDQCNIHKFCSNPNINVK